MKNFIIDNTKTLFYALIIALLIRSFFIQPFYIPSSSMEPNLEAISKYNPDLVLLSYDIGNVVEALKKVGINTILLPAAKNFEDILVQIRYLGKKTGNEEKSNLIAELLEPEAPNSYVSFGIIKTSLNRKLPIYRIKNFNN